MPASLDLIGQRFGRLVVTQRAGSARGRSLWRAICDCGAEAVASADCLRTGGTRSCGCVRRETARRNGARSDGSANVKHGGIGTPEYNTWKSMRRRASGKGSPEDRELYLGVTCCERWASFAHFLSDMGRRPSPVHSIDRINNLLGYEPDNCRWATPTTQANNRRQRRSSMAAADARAQLSAGASS